MAKTPASTEVDSYIFILDSLKTLGWDTRNPERTPSGQVYTQNECLANPEIKKHLLLERPENIVKVSERVLWIIEAKRTHAQLAQALAEAEQYAIKLNNSNLLQVRFISGVAGNEYDSFLVETRFYNGMQFVPVKLNGIQATGLLSLEQIQQIIDTQNPNIENVRVDEKLFLSSAETINKILHLGAVNPHQRAGVMAALLLSTLSNTMPNIEGSPIVLIKDINSRVEDVLIRQSKREFTGDVTIPLPATTDNHIKLRQALVDTLQELNKLNIRSAMRSGDDWLGAFYEVFLKYASWAQDLGIVLTPRHLTKFIADVMDIQANDIVYDPTCGTGGFLVAALDYVKQHASETQLARFKQYSVFGIEQDSGVAALAVVNMIFRGDGKNNIQEGNCFTKNLERITIGHDISAQYIPTLPSVPPVTKVMMNPPFALKRSDEKEYKFIDYALEQMQHGGILFCVLPYSAMVKPGSYQLWRKRLLQQHTLLAVMTLPGDIFYPVGVTTVGIFIKKGIPHPASQNILWLRTLQDGLLKSKGRRLPNQRAENDFSQVQALLKAFLRNPSHTIPKIFQFQEAIPLQLEDASLELVPEAYLDQKPPEEHELSIEMAKSIREIVAYLIKIDRLIIKPEFLQTPTAMPLHSPTQWRKYGVTEIFRLTRGHFHSLAALDEGIYPTISRVSTDNGFVGFYDMPEKAKLMPAKTITISTVAGDSFVQPVPFIATDNVVLCTLLPNYKDLSLEALFFIALMLNMVKWRYSYGRQCYQTRFVKTEFLLPVNADDALDENYMQTIVQNTPYWQAVKATIENS